MNPGDPGAPRVRVGVVGCGAIAQMMHLPHLRELADRFELFALCDIDPVTLRLVGDYYGVARRHTHARELIAEPIDVVMILSSGDHAPEVLAALEAGRDVFVEKPLAYTPRETDAVLEAAAPLYGVDFDRMAVSRILRREPVRLLEEATGSSRPDVLAAYVLLIGSSVHDVNALIGVLGPPERVVNAALWAGGTSFTTTLAFAGGVHATYTWAMLPYVKHYQEDFSFYAADGRVHIRFPSPYLRNAPTPVEIERMDGVELHVTRVIASYEEAFKLELLHLYDCVVERKQPLTSAAGFRTDLEVLMQIARAFG